MISQSYLPNNVQYQQLIVDCGGTKADWCLLGKNIEPYYFKTVGFNVSLHPTEDFHTYLADNLSPYLTALTALQTVHFYGAGCTKAMEEKVREQFQHIFPLAIIHAHSDLLGAARAVCGKNEGVAVILGTGANSCLYNGQDMVRNISPLGYILGDEGSGAILGRRLLADIFKGLLPSELISAFQKDYPLTQTELIQHVYRENGANHYMASFTPFLSKHIHMQAIQQLLHEEFSRFFERNIQPYNSPHLPISFVGGIAFAFQETITAIAEEKGFSVGKFLQSPIEGLGNYHSNSYL